MCVRDGNVCHKERERERCVRDREGEKFEWRQRKKDEKRLR